MFWEDYGFPQILIPVRQDSFSLPTPRGVFEFYHALERGASGEIFGAECLNMVKVCRNFRRERRKSFEGSGKAGEIV